MTDEERKLVLHYLKYEAEPPRLYSNSKADCEYWKMRVKALQKLIDELEHEPCTKLIDVDRIKKEYRKRFIQNLVDKDRGIDLSKYAEEPCNMFDEFIDSIVHMVESEGKD